MASIALELSPIGRPTRMTASNRPTVDLQSLFLVHYISNLIDDDCRTETPPSSATKQEAMKLLLSIPFHLSRDPDVGAFCGEIHIQWARGNKQVVVMCFPNRAALIHHYLRVPHAQSEHGVEGASADRVEHWLEWLRT